MTTKKKPKTLLEIFHAEDIADVKRKESLVEASRRAAQKVSDAPVPKGKIMRSKIAKGLKKAVSKAAVTPPVIVTVIGDAHGRPHQFVAYDLSMPGSLDYARYAHSVCQRAVMNYDRREQFVAYHAHMIAHSVSNYQESNREQIVAEHMAAVHKTAFGILS